MPRYQSVDALQNMLADTVFANTQASKKAAGRALGVLVELITFYLIRDWQLEDDLAIERGLEEYGNSSIKHNVEFTLHPSKELTTLDLGIDDSTITSTRLFKAAAELGVTLSGDKKSRNVRQKNLVRHAAVIADTVDKLLLAHYKTDGSVKIVELKSKPFAMFECKRVGVEEGMKKGPQSIEKAKQGAYVARTVSGMQRVARKDGSVAAILEDSDGNLVQHDSYYQLLRDAIDGANKSILQNVVLTVGVVSNHGNWFTAETQNKEMRVLAQSYDWLLFLTDDGLAEFIETVLNGNNPKLEATRTAFKASFGRQGGTTSSFTKVQIDAAADKELTEYFAETQPWERWFNVISPSPQEVQATANGATVTEVPIINLRNDLRALRDMYRGV
ncbi:hypothetical protein EII31_03800 [Leucobacter sp. OH2974_COT-288]|nr:hypothetical protein EII31_03800 [Leucobacter sp. OH2974_COT-288]